MSATALALELESAISNSTSTGPSANRRPPPSDAMDLMETSAVATASDVAIPVLRANRTAGSSLNCATVTPVKGMFTISTAAGTCTSSPSISNLLSPSRISDLCIFNPVKCVLFSLFLARQEEWVAGRRVVRPPLPPPAAYLYVPHQHAATCQPPVCVSLCVSTEIERSPWCFQEAN